MFTNFYLDGNFRGGLIFENLRLLTTFGKINPRQKNNKMHLRYYFYRWNLKKKKERKTSPGYYLRGFFVCSSPGFIFWCTFSVKEIIVQSKIKQPDFLLEYWSVESNIEESGYSSKKVINHWERKCFFPNNP